MKIIFLSVLRSCSYTKPLEISCVCTVALPVFFRLAKIAFIFAYVGMKITFDIFFCVTWEGWENEIYKDVNIKDINTESGSLHMYSFVLFTFFSNLTE